MQHIYQKVTVSNLETRKFFDRIEKVPMFKKKLFSPFVNVEIYKDSLDWLKLQNHIQLSEN